MKFLKKLSEIIELVVMDIFVPLLLLVAILSFVVLLAFIVIHIQKLK